MPETSTEWAAYVMYNVAMASQKSWRRQVRRLFGFEPWVNCCGTAERCAQPFDRVEKVIMLTSNSHLQIATAK